MLLWSTALPLDSSRPYWLVTKDSSNPWLSVVAFYLYSWTTYSPTVGTLNCHLFITAQQASSTRWSPPIPSLHTQTRTCNCRRCSWCRIRVPTPQVMQSRDHYITIVKQKCIFIIAMVDVPLPASHVNFSRGGRVSWPHLFFLLFLQLPHAIWWHTWSRVKVGKATVRAVLLRNNSDFVVENLQKWSTVHGLCLKVFFSWLHYMLHEKRSKTIYDQNVWLLPVD